MREYYDRRAREYEQIYERDDSVRQSEQASIAEAMRMILAGRRVLEVACGTGYWTQCYAEVAEYVVATDVSTEMLALAEEKNLAADKMEFKVADAYELETVDGTFDAGVANFWLSHVPKARMNEFLAGFHDRLGSGAVVFMADNVFVPGIGGELVSRPEAQDTFKRRLLADGSQYEIIKNYYESDQLRDLFRPWANKMQINVAQCFWWIWYEISD